MATASKIKSAIRSRGAAQRGVTQQLAGVTEQLLKAQESSNLARMRQQEYDRMFGTLSSGLELGSTIVEQVKQDAKLQKDIESFEKSLPLEAREQYRVEEADISLMDVFKEKNTLTEFLSQEDRYFLGERELGSKYDVAARGQEIRSKSLVKNLLESTEGPSMMDTSSKFPSILPEPKLNFDMGKIFKSKKSILVDEGRFMKAAGDDPQGISLGDYFDQFQGESS
tara:strand:- start:525 stop:1199 length:675 start_codon:yes stop_codon:yes gene_type:complete